MKADRPTQFPWWEKLRIGVNQTRIARLKERYAFFQCTCSEHSRLEFPEGFPFVPTEVLCVMCGRRVQPTIVEPV